MTALYGRFRYSDLKEAVFGAMDFVCAWAGFEDYPASQRRLIRRFEFKNFPNQKCAAVCRRKGISVQDTYTIGARVGAGILAKADRLFRNDDEGLFVELLQNSRRAGATRVEVTIRKVESSSRTESEVTVHDNGEGIADFARLLVLGESGWDSATQEKEDPAGMGFYALCLSGARVASGNQYCDIAPAAFRGEVNPVVETRDEYVYGTRLAFLRSSPIQALETALKTSAEFYPVAVYLNGEELARHDFLEGALHREVIDGIEVGLATRFAHSWTAYGDDKNWNFYGARIQDYFPGISGIVPESGSPSDVYPLKARFNVLETGRLKLQLPDRRSVIQDKFLAEFKKKARAAAYRCFQKQRRHALAFADWQEARSLGVELPEASPLLTTWEGLAADDSGHQMFGEDSTHFVADLEQVMLISKHVVDIHTLQGALHSGACLDRTLYREDSSLDGYCWYDSLPRLKNVAVVIDGIPAAEHLSTRKERPETIELHVTIEQKGRKDRRMVLPAFIHVDSEDLNAASFAAIKNSPWDNDDNSGVPFSIEDFLTYANFCYFDEGDLWNTQMDQYQDWILECTNEYFRGPRTSLIAILRRDFSHDARKIAARLDISKISFTRQPETPDAWTINLMDGSGEST